MNDKPKKLSVSIADDALELLEFLAQAQGISRSEALRKAIATEAYLQQERLEGSRVLLQKSSQEVREISFS